VNGPCNDTVVDSNDPEPMDDLSKEPMQTVAKVTDTVFLKFSKVKISNDMGDACKTKCKLCNQEIKLVAMREHTKNKHNMNISEYKAKFGKNYELIEKICHKCCLCQEIILLDSDSIATHLKSAVHRKKDPQGTTHKEYNDKYMVTAKTRGLDKKLSAV